MESMLSNYMHLDNAPHRLYKPTPVTVGEFATALDGIEIEQQKNADFLRNPCPSIEPNEFHKQASIAQKIAQDLSIRESQGLPPAWGNLAHRQEVILYGTSRLRAAVTAWINAAQNDETYGESRTWWINSLMIELVSDPSNFHLSYHQH